MNAETREALIRSVKVSFVVGTTLNLLNHGGAIFKGVEVNYWLLVLNYCVPFLVSFYSGFQQGRSTDVKTKD